MVATEVAVQLAPEDFQHIADLTASPAEHINQFKQALTRLNKNLEEQFYAERDITMLIHKRAQIIDVILQQAWRLYFSVDLYEDIALVAVGGYGRAELHPRSDIDLLILLAKDKPQYREPVSQFVTFLWDIGLEIGHSVRTVKECVREAKNDITVVTNLQESRLLVGANELYQKQMQKCSAKKIWPSKDFFQAKWQEQKSRHLRYNDTAYNLEPNIKECPGGLRDIQIIGWVAKRHFDAETLHDLVVHDFLTEEEYATLHNAQAFLWKIRFGLHVIANRCEDRLLFDHQRTLATQFGYKDDKKSLAVEKFMKQYYRTVMELNRLNEMLLQLFQEEILYKTSSAKPVHINNRFQASKGFLELKDDKTFAYYPFALLEVFLLIAQHSELKGIRANTIRQIRAHCHLINEEFRSDIRCRTLFMEILRQPHGVTHELRRMNRYGILAAYLPVFGQIVGQMQHDLFHVYTVDEHTLMVIRNIRRFTVEQFKTEYPLCSELIQKIPKQELLVLGGLFHDIAKGRGGDHSRLGEADAVAFCRRHGLSDYDTNLVAWLVLNHLVMSSTAQRKDISDPDVVHEFACFVGSIVRLNYIYLLTVADIRATGPDVWNSWKDSLLKELYHATHRALRRGLDNPIIESETIAETKSVAKTMLLAQGLDEALIEQTWQRFSDEYFLRHFADEISWHTEAILNCQEEDLPLILIRKDAKRGGTTIFIYLPEHDHVFAHMTSIMEQLNVTVVDAKILGSNDGYTLNSFAVLNDDGKAITDEQQIKQIQRLLHKRLKQPEQSLSISNPRLPRQTKAFRFPTNVQFWQDEKYHCTAMQIITNDRPGLLSKIAHVLVEYKLDLHNAKIATFGERAEDIFYISNKDGSGVSDEQVQTGVRESLAQLLDSGGNLAKSG